ncbi:M16 family metallopeptidase [Vibrio pectenicida]|uniref:Insulinase family protein n=1 Tax=Vibrio pectenicida TaxID=62763 RepID=A0A427U7C9_9VIBR|nr:M16 family metallopeptidase [Vibrio pectenicida]RSD32586.1 insulinase family protein [Vibrio pectenicida]
MKKLFALCWLLLVGCAQNTPSSPVPIQLNTNWSSGTLKNGLKYHLYPMDSKEVSIRLLVHVGSTAEESSQLGYAHYVEHLAFEGSENFTPKEVERLMETTGAKKWHGVNATTSYDNTTYKFNLPNLEAFDKAMLWLRDVASGITFSPEEIEQEKSILLSENQYRRPEQQSFSDKYYDYAIKGTIYAQRSPLGTTDAILSATPESLKAFYNKWYQPQNAELIIAGNIDRAQAKVMIEKLFSDWAATNTEYAPELPLLTAKNDDFIAKVADDEHAILGLRFDRGDSLVSTQEHLLNSELDYIAAQLIRLRLRTILDEQSIPYQWLYSDVSSFRNLSIYEVSFAFSEPERNLVQPIFLKTLASLRDHGVSESELDIIMADYISWRKHADEDWETSKPEYFINEKITQLITGAPTQSRKGYKLSLDNAIRSSDINTVNQHLNNMLSSHYGMFVGVGATESIEHIKQALPEWKNMYKITGVVDNKINFDVNGLVEVKSSSPLPDSVVYENGEELWTLGNGVEVLLDPDVNSDFVNLVYMSAGGKAALDRDLLPAAQILFPVIARSGTGNFNGSQMKAYVRKNSIEMQGFIDDTEHGFEMSVPREHFNQALQFMHTSLVYPKFDPRQVDVIKQEFAEQAMSYLKSPLGQWYDAMDTNTYASSSAYFPNYARDFNKVTVDQVQQAFEQLFRQSRNNKLVIVADVKSSDITDALNDYVSTLPLQQASVPSYQIDYNPRPDAKINLAINNEQKGRFILRTHNKNAQVQDVRRELIDQIIENILANRLDNYVREDLSLDYSPASYSAMSYNQTITDWVIESQVAVSDLTKVEQAVDKVVNDLQTVITEGELSVAKKRLDLYLEDVVSNADSSAWVRSMYMVNGFGKNVLTDAQGIIFDISIDEVKERIDESFGKGTESYKYILSPLD